MPSPLSSALAPHGAAAPTLLQRLLRTKPLTDFAAPEAAAEGHGLRRSMGLFHLTMMGVGATIGTGIFVLLTGSVPKAGPGVLLAFVLAGITAALTALCYAELASTIPVSGSANSYAYATLGEVVAYGVGWCLLLEYGVSAAAIAVGWGEYLNELLQQAWGWQLPRAISAPPGRDGALFNLPGAVLVGMCGVLLVRGARESAAVNTVMVLLKLAVLVMFVAIAFTSFRSEHLTPFLPMGMAGVSAAASSIFFSYIGIDAVSTASEEVENPRRNLPLAILLSLLIVTALYIVVALAALGAQPWTEFQGQEAGLANILSRITGARWPAVVLSIGAIIAIFSVTLIVLYGQTRILFAMSRDGLLPQAFGRVHPRTMTPVFNTVVVCAFAALLAGLVPLDALIDLTSLGTLVAFTVVSVGVIVLRRTRPELPRGFRVPLYPLVPLASVGFCLYLVGSLPVATFVMFGVMLVVAAGVYTVYGLRHSRLERGPR